MFNSFNNSIHIWSSWIVIFSENNGGQNNSQSTDMTLHILPFVQPEFSVIMKMTGDFFSCTTGKELKTTNNI